MDWLDIVLIVVLALSTFMGLKTGLTKTVIILAGLIVGVILAGQYYVSLGGWLSSYIPQPNLAQVVAFAAILLTTLLAAFVLAIFLKKIISLTLLGWIDRLGGALFGLAVGSVVLGALLTVMVRFPFFDLESLFRESVVASALLGLLPFLLGLLPEEFDAVRSFLA